jgi:hypothetical protein
MGKQEEKPMKKNIAPLLLVIVVFLFLAACFNPWKEEGNMGTITINLGGGNGRSVLAWPPTLTARQKELSLLAVWTCRSWIIITFFLKSLASSI